jgi:tetratricopeptide (TPR) repeat protein
MIRNILTLSFILSLVLLVSCSTTKTKEQLMDEALEKEFAWIENSDFNKIPEIPFKPGQDKFVGKESKHDALTAESIARLPEPKLEDIEENSENDPVARIISLCYQRQFNKALKVFDENYHRYKKHPSYWNQLGTCHFLQHNYRKALLYYNKARDLNSKYAPPINNLGVIYQKEGKDQKALLAFKKASKMNLSSRTPTFNLAQLYLKYGFVDKAFKLFNSLYAANNKDVDVVNAMAVCFLLKGNVDQAIAYYKKLDSDYYEQAHVGLNYAIALKIKGEDGKAKRIFKDIEGSNLKGLRVHYGRVAQFIGL